jgi:hypothetical protein
VGSNAETFEARAEFDRLREMLLADSAAGAELLEIWSPETFAARLCGLASGRGLRLEEADVAARLAVASARNHPTLRMTPAAGWLPAAVAGDGAGAQIRWVFMGARRLTEPTYEESVTAAEGRPFNRLFGFSTLLASLAPPTAALAPSGFIFHMSRCGSTLVAQMLAASPANIVIAEAPPLDAVISVDAAAAGLDAAGHAALLRAMVGALGQPRGEARCVFLKLDSWHIHALPLLRRAFPATPWVFLYREPVEVMVSHRRRAGLQVTPGMLPPSVLGGAAWDGGSLEDYAARVLAAVCERAAHEVAAGGGLLVNYAELPAALGQRILPHFGMTATTDELAAMEAAATRDAKDPLTPFTPDSASKRAAATSEIRAAVARHLAAPYERLEALRGSR